MQRVLRQARGGELGPAMDENVRMLATEIAVRCFERPPNERPSEANGWKSLTKAMSVDLEKARKGVHKNFQQFSQNAEKQIGKAERAFERSATMFLQEAENIFVGPSPSGPSGLGDRDRDDQGSRPQLTKEEEELQWALRASLDEARRSQASGDGHFLAEPAEARQGEAAAAGLAEAQGGEAPRAGAGSTVGGQAVRGRGTGKASRQGGGCGSAGGALRLADLRGGS
ncbi:unnamed protein product [Effrenium voratum]|nr:unnamed protein product [Effrenium voratum]